MSRFINAFDFNPADNFLPDDAPHVPDPPSGGPGPPQAPAAPPSDPPAPPEKNNPDHLAVVLSGRNPFARDGEQIPDLDSISKLSLSEIDIVEAADPGCIDRWQSYYQFEATMEARSAQAARIREKEDWEHQVNEDPRALRAYLDAQDADEKAKQWRLDEPKEPTK